MKLSEQVISLEQAKRLKELGVIQESLFYHTHFTGNGDGYFFSSKHNEIYFKDNCKEYKDIGDYDFENSPMTPTGEDRAGRYKIASAFTVAELGVMLPPFTYSWMGRANTYGCVSSNQEPNDDYINYSVENGQISNGANEAECRAAQLIYLLENNLVTPAEINQRLTQK